MAMKTQAAQNSISGTEEVYLSNRQLQARYSVGRSTLHYWMQNPEFPTPYRMSTKTLRWRLSELEEWEKQNKHVNGGEAA